MGSKSSRSALGASPRSTTSGFLIYGDGVSASALDKERDLRDRIVTVSDFTLMTTSGLTGQNSAPSEGGRHRTGLAHPGSIG